MKTNNILSAFFRITDRDTLNNNCSTNVSKLHDSRSKYCGMIFDKNNALDIKIKITLF